MAGEKVVIGDEGDGIRVIEGPMDFAIQLCVMCHWHTIAVALSLESAERVVNLINKWSLR